MHIGIIDLSFIAVAVAILLAPLLIGYFGFGRKNRHLPLLKKGAICIAALQVGLFFYFGWIFTTQSQRHVNHLKWVMPLIFVYLMIWVCFGIGFGAAALRCRIKTESRQQH